MRTAPQGFRYISLSTLSVVKLYTTDVASGGLLLGAAAAVGVAVDDGMAGGGGCDECACRSTQSCFVMGVYPPTNIWSAWLSLESVDS